MMRHNMQGSAVNHELPIIYICGFHLNLCTKTVTIHQISRISTIVSGLCKKMLSYLLCAMSQKSEKNHTKKRMS